MASDAASDTASDTAPTRRASATVWDASAGFQIVGLLGIVKSGAGHASVDPDHPAKGVSPRPPGITVIPGECLETLFGHHPGVFDDARTEVIKDMLSGLVEAVAAAAETEPVR